MCSEDGEHWNLVGLAVATLGRCGNNTSIYSRVSNQTKFIISMMTRVVGMFYN